MNHRAKNVKPLARKEGLVIQELPVEVLVYDLDRDKAHCLNETAAMVWRKCNGCSSSPVRLTTYCESRNCESSPCKGTSHGAMASTMVDCRKSAALSVPFSCHRKSCRRKNRSFSGFFNEFLNR